MSDQLINQITIDCLINKTIYDKYMQSNITKLNNRKDKKFYRKRILSLTKELLINQEPENLFPDIKYCFENYVNTCIQYFKTIDNNDILQEDYSTILNETYLDDLDNLSNLSNLKNIGENAKEVNNLMMRSINIKSQTLDSFVTKKYIKKPDEIILPKEKNINLKDPILRKKGVIYSGKKKNITNNYDETNNTEKKDET
jgi:hypothetical protein